MNTGYHVTHIHISNFHYHCSNDSMISSWFKHYETDVPENRKTLTVAQIKIDYLETWNKTWYYLVFTVYSAVPLLKGGLWLHNVAAVSRPFTAPWHKVLGCFITSLLRSHSIGTYIASLNLSSLEMDTKSWKTRLATASSGSLFHRAALIGVIKTEWCSFPPNVLKRTMFSFIRSSASFWQVLTCQLALTLVQIHMYRFFWYNCTPNFARAVPSHRCH